MASYPPPVKPMDPPTVNPRRRLAPLGVALSMAPFEADNIQKPHLRAFDNCPSHLASVHFTPAAFPRCPSTPGSIELPEGLTGRERKEHVKRVTVALVDEKRALEEDLVRWGGVVEEGPDRVVSQVGLWNSVLRISRRRIEGEKLGDGVKRLTIVATHPNGLHKEVSCCEGPWAMINEMFSSDLGNPVSCSYRLDRAIKLDCANRRDLGVGMC